MIFSELQKSWRGINYGSNNMHGMRKKFSDMASACQNCGCPTEYVKQATINKKREDEPIKCPFCGSESIDSCGYCNECGQKIPPSVFGKTPQPQYTSQTHESHSTYTDILFSGRKQRCIALDAAAKIVLFIVNRQ